MMGSFLRVRTVCVLAVAALPSITIGCKSEDQPPPQQGGYPQQQYPQQQYPQQQQQYPQQQYPQQQYPQQPAQPAPAPAPAPATPAAPQMSQPGPAALPCSTDAQCLLHRCNTQYGKCAFPCATDADCNPGNRCQAPLCIPGAPAPAQ